MKIKNYFAVAITLLSLGMFVACNSDEEYDQTFANNEKILKSEFAKSTIAPTKTIPAAIRAKMDSVELDIFSKLSTIGYVDYSFFDTDYYAENKQKILESLYQAYNKYVEEGKENIYFSICSPYNYDFSRLVSITPTEVENGAIFQDSITCSPFSFKFLVRLRIESNGYSVSSFSLKSTIPDDYIPRDDITPAHVALSGLTCTLSIYNASYLNTTDSTILNLTVSKNVSLNFPPQPPTTLSLGN